GEAAARVYRARLPGRGVALQGARGGDLRDLCQRPHADEGRRAHRQSAGPRPQELTLPGRPRLSRGIAPTRKRPGARPALSLLITAKGAKDTRRPPRVRSPSRSVSFVYFAAAWIAGRRWKCGMTCSPTMRYCSTMTSCGVVSGGDRLMCCIP